MNKDTDKEKHLTFKLFMYHYWRIYISGDYSYEDKDTQIHTYQAKRLRTDKIAQLRNTIAIIPHSCSCPTIHNIRAEVLRFYNKRLSILLAECDYRNPASLTHRPLATYEEFYNLFVAQYRFIRHSKTALLQKYMSQPFIESVYESVFHPDCIIELRATGLSFSTIAALLDERLLSFI